MTTERHNLVARLTESLGILIRDWMTGPKPLDGDALERVIRARIERFIPEALAASLPSTGAGMVTGLTESFAIYTVEGDDDVWFSTGGTIIARWGEHTPEGMALLRLDAAVRSALEPVAVEAEPPTIRTELSDETKAHLKELSDAARAGAVSLARNPPIVGATAPLAVDQAMRDVAAERRRQIEAEGWTAGHDDTHKRGELAQAAAAYAYFFTDAENSQPSAEDLFPTTWSPEWWKPTNHRRDLVKAGALILAEIERLDRAVLSQEPVPATSEERAASKEGA